MEIYLELFLAFLKIGIFAFGGGYAILTLIQHEMIVHNWMTIEEFTDIVAISQMTPGPIGINSATYVGYVASGSVWGAVVATVAIVLPSFIIMLLLCKFIALMQGNKYFGFVMQGIRPAVVGLIAAAALFLMNTENFIDYKSFIIFVAIVALSLKFRLHPILSIVLAGFAGYLIY